MSRWVRVEFQLVSIAQRYGLGADPGALGWLVLVPGAVVVPDLPAPGVRRAGLLGLVFVVAVLAISLAGRLAVYVWPVLVREPARLAP